MKIVLINVVKYSAVVVLSVLLATFLSVAFVGENVNVYVAYNGITSTADIILNNLFTVIVGSILMSVMNVVLLYAYNNRQYL
ncbi:hypothetical protein AB2T90_11040 [Clostridium butyricum]|uniref:hypothetical protein n=1 Tax=Clostridium butyricum TaxID=1492 RepID=UPI003466BA84